MLRTPLQRLKDTTKKKNLWLYILTLGKDQEVINEKVRSLLLEEYDFLPSVFRTKKVMTRLEGDGYISKERFKSKPAYTATDKGREELEKGISYLEELLEKLKK